MAGRAGKQESKQSGKEGGKEQPVAVRWYDARARVALRRVALWLRVPAAKLCTFECMLAQTVQVTSHFRASMSPCLHAHTHRLPMAMHAGVCAVCILEHVPAKDSCGLWYCCLGFQSSA